MTISTMLDITVLVVLLITIGYAIRLSRQLTGLRTDRDAINALIANLSTAVSRADAAIKNMRETALESGDGLQDKINAAREAFGELDIMIEAGNALAERLEGLAEKSRKAAQEKPKKLAGESRPDEIPESRAEPRIKPKTRAEQELLDAIRKQEAGS